MQEASIKRVLVAVDVSYAAAPTVAEATMFAGLFGAELRVVHVIEPLPLIAALPIALDQDAYYRVSKEQFNEEMSRILEGAEVSLVVRRGTAESALSEEVEQWDADVLVMGSHGKGWVDRLLVGSTTERLLNHLPTSDTCGAGSRATRYGTLGRVQYSSSAQQVRSMRVSELMQEDVQMVQEDLTVAEAVVTLADGHIQGLPVVSRQNRMVGVLSTSDVLQAAAECADAEERTALFESTQVNEVMTPRPKIISPDADVKEAAKQMLRLDVHRLFVEHQGTLVGVIFPE